MSAALAIRAVSGEYIVSRVRDFGSLLVDAIDGGASVGYVLPAERVEIDAFWRDIASDVAHGARHVLVAERDAAIVGTVQLAPSAKPNQRHRADVAKLLVHRSERRRGVASALMAAVESLALAEGRWLLTLDTRAGSDADRLYRRLGWTAVGDIPDYAADPDGTLAACTFLYKRLVPAASTPESTHG